jgi:hypothetical protein
MLATTGLQMSQPRPVPNRVTISLNVVSPATRTWSKSCARVEAKCSQSALLSVTPAASSSAPTRRLTSGRHEPHAAPAFVHALTPATSVHPSSVTADRMRPALTALQLQTSASSGSGPVAGRAPSVSGRR